MATEDVQTNLRLPADLKDRLQDAAKQSGRTLTAEVVYRLEGSFANPGGLFRAPGDHADWERMQALRSRATALSAERDSLARAREEMSRVAPRDADGHPTPQAIERIWDVTSRLYEVEQEIRDNDRAIDDLYDRLASTAPGSGAVFTSSKSP